jgi:hypothetical protein
LPDQSQENDMSRGTEGIKKKKERLETRGGYAKESGL